MEGGEGRKGERWRKGKEREVRKGRDFRLPCTPTFE